MSSIRNLALLFIPFVLLGCTTSPPTSTEIQSAEFGPEPTYSEMIMAVRNYISPFLKDPYSAKFNCSTSPTKGWAIAHPGSFEGFSVNFDASKVQYGYLARCNFNAKNGFGAYSGEKNSYYMIVTNYGVQHLLHFANGLKKFEVLN